MNRSPADRSAVAWLAYRYIADELSPAERDQFEQQLDWDQAAREAVAEAVQLTQAVEALPASAFDQPQRRPQWLQPAGWMALGAAACLMLMLGVHTLRNRAGTVEVAVHSGPTTDGGQLALAWSAWQTEAEETVDPVLQSPAVPVEPLTIGEAEQEIVAPDWLVVALGGDPEESETEEAAGTE